MVSVISLSGGIDSTTLLAMLIKAFEINNIVIPVQFMYGSKHNPFEKKAVDDILEYYNLTEHLVRIDLTSPFQHIPSALMASGAAIPEGHYKEETMQQTVVPGRNLIFASFCASIAEVEGQRAGCQAQVCLGIHAGDHHIYPDCRPSFFDSLNRTIQASSDRRVFCYAPFLSTGKSHIVRTGLHYGAPFHLTRTCYKAQELPCGVCGSCRERLEAFDLNNAKDPANYETRGVEECTPE